MLRRIPLFIIILSLACGLGWHITKGLIATSLLAYRQDGTSRALAVEFAPTNPATHAAWGKYLLYRAEAAKPPERLEAGLAALQRAASLTPNDYRYQMELARAYAANAQTREAGSSFQRAIQLAPRHFETHWAYANFALRAGERDTALAAFRQALALSGQDGAYRAEVEQASAQHAYAALTGAYGFDLGALERATPAMAKAQTHLVSFLAERESLDLALAKWRTLPVADAMSYRHLLFKLLAETQQAGRFNDAREVWLRLLAHEGEASDDLITNGGFERQPLSERFVDLQNGFDWQIEGHAEVAADRTELAAHAGNQSLRLRLVARLAEPFRHVTQRVVVVPNATYRLRFWVRASELPSEVPYLEIADATAPQGFRLTAAFPRQTEDWQEQSLRFTIPTTTNVIALRVCVPTMTTLDLNRRNTVWLDDVSLQRE